MRFWKYKLGGLNKDVNGKRLWKVNFGCLWNLNATSGIEKPYKQGSRLTFWENKHNTLKGTQVHF